MSDWLAIPFAVVDVHYGETGAVAACAVAHQWTDAVAFEEHRTRISEVKPYRPGFFFERELPCLLEVLSLVRERFQAVLIDGYVELDEHGTPGLGAHLHSRLDRAIAVVGAAKTAYRGGGFAAKVLRGDSRRPLFVTARGIPLEVAARLVRDMSGPSRIPTLVKRVDALAREIVQPRSASSEET